jgi:hypothetical protein
VLLSSARRGTTTHPGWSRRKRTLSVSARRTRRGRGCSGARYEHRNSQKKSIGSEMKPGKREMSSSMNGVVVQHSSRTFRPGSGRASSRGRSPARSEPNPPPATRETARPNPPERPAPTRPAAPAQPAEHATRGTAEPATEHRAQPATAKRRTPKPEHRPRNTSPTRPPGPRARPGRRNGAGTGRGPRRRPAPFGRPGRAACSFLMHAA